MLEWTFTNVNVATSKNANTRGEGQGDGDGDDWDLVRDELKYVSKVLEEDGKNYHVSFIYISVSCMYE